MMIWGTSYDLVRHEAIYQQKANTLSKTNLILRRAPFVVVAEKHSEAEVFFDFAVCYLNDQSDWHGGPLFSHDRQFFRMKDRSSGKLLLEAEKVSPELFGQMLRDHIVKRIKPGMRTPHVNSDLVDAAVARHRLAQNRRIRANLRYERNLVATKRHENAVMQVLRDRLAFRTKVENAAHWLNLQFKSPWRHRDSLFVYDYRECVMFYRWQGGLPVMEEFGHITDDVERARVRLNGKGGPAFKAIKESE